MNYGSLGGASHGKGKRKGRDSVKWDFLDEEEKPQAAYKLSKPIHQICPHCGREAYSQS